MTKTFKSDLKNLQSEISTLSTIRDDLASEIIALESDVERQRAELENDTESDAEDLYVFDEDDQTAIDFDQFFAESDPEVEKIRNDLLNDSPHRRRFGSLSARLSA